MGNSGRVVFAGLLPLLLAVSLIAGAACSEDISPAADMSLADRSTMPNDQNAGDQRPGELAVPDLPLADVWPNPYDLWPAQDGPGAADVYTAPDLSTADKDKDGYSVAQGDCDDNNNKIYPGSKHHLEGVDYDCDGVREYMATIELIVDDIYKRLCLNDVDIATNIASWKDAKVETYQRVMEAGKNVIGVHGVDQGGVISGMSIRVRVNGQLIRSHGAEKGAPDSARWRYFPKAISSPRAGWCSSNFDDKKYGWGPAVFVNEDCNGVWLSNPASFRTTRTDWVWDNDPKKLKDSWFRLEISLANSAPLKSAPASKPACTLGTPVTLTSLAGRTGYEPDLASDGLSVGAVWSDACCPWKKGDWEIYMATLSGAGALLTQPVKLTNAIYWGRRPALSRTKTGYGIAFEDCRSNRQLDRVWFMGATDKGAKVATEAALTGTSQIAKAPRMVWTGSGYGLVWQDSRHGVREIYFARLSSTGSKVGSDLRLTSTKGSSVLPEIAWTGKEFGVFWVDSRDGNHELYFARVSATGTKIGADIRLTTSAPAETWDPEVIFADGKYAVAYQDEVDGNVEIFFMQVDTAGKAGKPLRITKDQGISSQPSLAFNGSHHVLVWRDNRGGVEDIYLARVDKTGAKVGADELLVKTPGNSARPDLVWVKGGSHMMAWQQAVTVAGKTRTEVQAAPVTCK